MLVAANEAHFFLTAHLQNLFIVELLFLPPQKFFNKFFFTFTVVFPETFKQMLMCKKTHNSTLNAQYLNSAAVFSSIKTMKTKV